ncbi:bc25d216-efbc-47c5-89f2-accb3c57f34e [Sclerotinia trifoliorum]|uniref:Bc25d216-efbc-47c5-89f2-accb3c57f34e n=1 Tax=Sclerotinia trifoliorum TaxID=28548 RepID=A0A8H2ZKK9_9HELO|nr:bc25d216-efbc-47c5-89f2-accb3c57f34e [Sclerotinia trifoliorum]
MDEPPLGPPPIETTVLLLGDPDVGKSTFLSKPPSNLSSSASSTQAQLLLDSRQPFTFGIRFSNIPYRINFYDSSSPIDWKTLKPNVVVLCYAVPNRLSLVNVQRFWAKQLQTAFQYELPILLLALKRDLRSEKDPNGIIYPQEGHRIAQELRCDRYMECSSMTGELVAEVWEDISRTAVLAAGGGKGGSSGGGGLSDGGCVIM